MDPVLDLCAAMRARLLTDSGVAALVGSRVYDTVPSPVVEPYISIGPTNYQSEYTDCIVGGEVMVQVDGWSTYGSRDEVRKIAHAVRKALRADLTLQETALVSLEHWRTDYLDDPDGVTKHASIRFTGYVEEA